MLQLITGAPNQPFFSGVPVGPPSAQQGWGGPPRERETSSAPRPPRARTATQPQPQPVAPSDGVSRHPWTLSSFSVAGIALLSLGPPGPSCPASGRRVRLPAGHHGGTCGPFQAPQVRFYVSDSLRRRIHPGRALFRTALRPRLPPAPGPIRPCAAPAARGRPLLAPPRIAPSRGRLAGRLLPIFFLWSGWSLSPVITHQWILQYARFWNLLCVLTVPRIPFPVKHIHVYVTVFPLV